MTYIRFRKEKISIQNIGQLRFWIGVIAGVISAISISLFFNLSREALRSLTSLSGDLLILKESELQFFNYFFSILASVLGLTITIWIWMQNKEHKRRKDSIYKQLSRSNAWVIFWIILLVIARFGSLLPLILFSTHGYDNHLDLFGDYWILFVLIPIVVFMQSWFFVRLVYSAGKWIFISFLFCLLTAYTLQITTTVNQEKLNGAYHQRFENDYNYIDREIKTAASEYGIEFDTKTIDILKKWYAESSVDQIMSIKKAFANNKPVSMDTIILQKIIIRNYKQGAWYYRQRNSIENWDYALPKDVLTQLNHFDSNSDQAKELFKIIKEQIDLVNTPEIDWNDHKKYTETEKKRSRGAKYNIPDPLIEQLKEVRMRLLEDNRYYNLSKELPEIKTFR